MPVPSKFGPYWQMVTSWNCLQKSRYDIQNSPSSRAWRPISFFVCSSTQVQFTSLEWWGRLEQTDNVIPESQKGALKGTMMSYNKHMLCVCMLYIKRWQNTCSIKEDYGTHFSVSIYRASRFITTHLWVHFVIPESYDKAIACHTLWYLCYNTWHTLYFVLHVSKSYLSLQDPFHSLLSPQGFLTRTSLSSPLTCLICNCNG